MLMTYANEIGTLKLYGGSGELFNICSVEGLEPPSKERYLQSYASEDGYVECSSHYNQRIITVSADVKCSDNSAIKEAARILSHAGVLQIKTGLQNRKIFVNAATITIGKRYGSFCTLVIQMTCDYPHFTDADETQVPLFRKINYLTAEAQLPLLLTERISQGTVTNKGDIEIYPVVTIIKTSDESGENTITVSNLTTGKSLLFNKELQKDEEIIIDVKNRTVTSNIEGNIIKTLNREYSLADMKCSRGENEISVTVGGSERGIAVYITYENEYTEAI